MKGTYAVAALALAALVAVGVTIAQRSLDDDTTAKPEKTALFSTQSADERGQLEAEQMRIALEEMQEETEARRHKLVLTIRDEAPLGIWKVNGQMCILAYGPSTTTISVSQPTDDASTFQVRQEFVPSEARLLKSGACETTVNVLVRDAPSYDLSLSDGTSKTTHVVHEGESQKVTIVH